MKKYPRTEKYDNNWISENWMGPNPLWLLEELCEHLDLKPGVHCIINCPDPKKQMTHVNPSAIVLSD
jgi:hypothetical protein